MSSTRDSLLIANSGVSAVPRRTKAVRLRLSVRLQTVSVRIQIEAHLQHGCGAGWLNFCSPTPPLMSLPLLSVSFDPAPETVGNFAHEIPAGLEYIQCRKIYADYKFFAYPMTRDEIKINGVVYVPSRIAARNVDLVPDYVTRLCRLGFVRGTRSQGIWYVDEASLREFLTIKQEHRKDQLQHISAIRRQELARFELRDIADSL